MSYIVKTVGESVILGTLIIKSGQGVTGLSPTVEIRRMSDGSYLDFDAVADPFWVLSGGRRENILTEVSWLPGYYIWTFDHAVYGTGTQDDYTAIYRCVAPYRLLQTETVSFEENFPASVDRILGHMENKQTIEALTPTHYLHTVYKEDGTSVLHQADLTMNTGGTIETRTPR